MLHDFIDGAPRIGATYADVFGDFGLEGDDVNEFLGMFAEEFGTDISPLLWYFHYNGDEPPGHRRVFARGDQGAILPLVPISLEMLVRAAEMGKWTYQYPPHNIAQSLRSRFALPALFALILATSLTLFWQIG